MLMWTQRRRACCPPEPALARLLLHRLAQSVRSLSLFLENLSSLQKLLLRVNFAQDPIVDTVKKAKEDLQLGHADGEMSCIQIWEIDKDHEQRFLSHALNELR